MDAKSLYVNAADEPWRETPYEGITFRKLHYDRATGRSAVLVKFEPGSVYGAHRHPEGEEYYVLEGTLKDGGRTWGPGSYVLHPPGSSHRPSSPDGCTVFISLPAQVEILGEEECRGLEED